MSVRLEKTIFDRFFNGFLLKKRKIGQPFRYVVPKPSEYGRLEEIIWYPKTPTQRFVSNCFERMLPTLQFFLWNPIVRDARESGWTIQEKLYHNWFRVQDHDLYMFTQSMHPMGYIERQRADGFIRRVTTILPGSTPPEWAAGNRRFVEFDFDSMILPEITNVIRNYEMTPAPHWLGSSYLSASHMLGMRYNVGYWARRWFYNEEVKGGVREGFLTESDKEIINSWYSGVIFHKEVLDQKRPQEEIEERRRQDERRIRLINQHFPEYSHIKQLPETGIINEPYYERHVDEIRNAILISKWVQALENRTFSQAEVREIYEFFLQERDDAFWRLDETDGLYKPTPLYEKFNNALNLPSAFEIRKFTGRAPEIQFRERIIINYGINNNTVEDYKRMNLSFLEQLGINRNDQQVNGLLYKRLRTLVTEEVYNPLFRRQIRGEFNVGEVKSGASIVALIYKQKGADALSRLEEIEKSIRENELHFLTKEVQQNFFQRVKNVVKTFPFKHDF